MLPVRNGQDDCWELGKRERISGKVLKKYRKRIFACFSCPIGCMPFFQLGEGPYAGRKGKGFWINSAMSYATRFDIDNPRAVIACHLLANRLGLDGDNAAVVISWAFECFERGVLTKNETDGLELEWGNPSALMKMLEKLAFRDGVGNLLANGVKIASEKVGRGSKSYAIHVKGQDCLDGIRIRKAWALGVLTAPCAGRHLRGAIGSFQQKGDHLTYGGQAKRVFWQEQYKAIQDMIGVCVYLGLWSGALALTPDDYSKLTSTATGVKVSAERLMRIGRQVHNIEKAFNTLHKGFTRKDDLPPRRYMTEPVKSGPHKGELLEKVKMDVMLDEYYALHGWDKRTSWQTRNCLMKLGLPRIAEKLEKAKKLIYS